MQLYLCSLDLVEIENHKDMSGGVEQKCYSCRLGTLLGMIAIELPPCTLLQSVLKAVGMVTSVQKGI